MVAPTLEVFKAKFYILFELIEFTNVVALLFSLISFRILKCYCNFFINFVLSLVFLFILPLVLYSLMNLSKFIQMSVKNTAIKSMPLSA